jgi:uncharacterized membrane protein (UPF0127 family)
MCSLRVGSRTLRVEVAADEVAKRLGLMYRESLPEDEGMLFVYSDPDHLGFYMRNTPVPLSIAFIDDEGKILEIRDLKPKDETTIRSKNKVCFALEVNQGWFAKAGVGVGDTIPEFKLKAGAFKR